MERSLEKIKQKILSSENPVTVVLLGPQTNWCYLFREYPSIKNNI